MFEKRRSVYATGDERLDDQQFVVPGLVTVTG